MKIITGISLERAIYTAKEELWLVLWFLRFSMHFLHRELLKAMLVTLGCAGKDGLLMV